MRKSLRLRAFGGLVLEGDDLSGAARQPRRLALLAVLAVAGSKGIRRDKILALFWPDVDEPRGRQALSQSLYALRKDTHTEDLVLGSDTLRLNSDVITSDIEEFEAAIAGGDRERATDLYSAPFLDGVYIADAPAFERWSEDQRLRYAELAERTIEALAHDADKRGEHHDATKWWRKLTALDPLQTRGALGLMNALAAAGYRADAIRHAESYASLVREELDANPNKAVTSLADRLREIHDEAPADPTSAALAGRFEIEREIGRGGMAVVFLAHDRKHNRRVAVKMLHPNLGSTIGRDRLQREIMVTARLQHPHILPLYDSLESDGTLFYVMPFVEGESLRARLAREERLPIADALRVAYEVADALAHAHRHGIIHRDIKPENVLLADGHAIVADFGIARTVISATLNATLTETGFALGTPAYMSPEQIAGDNVDARTDIYSLGCVLYETIAGRPPWIGTDPRTLMARRFTEPAPRLRDLVTDCTDDIDDMLTHMLAPDPGERYSDGGEAAKAIAALMTSPRARAPQAARLPTFNTPLIGRDKELRSARSLLTSSGVRVLTLTGAGGSGKTRLAVQLAGEVSREFPEGVFFVDLSAVSEPSHVLPTITQRLGIKDRGGNAPFDTVSEFFGDRRALLVLDNLEQVLAVTPELARLLQACPRLTILVTSRVLLRMRGEHEFHVAPLVLPDLNSAAAEIRNTPAVQLFVERAKEVRPAVTFDDEALRSIAQICVRVDGLPLAIELAAARSKVLTPQQIETRLANRLDLLSGRALDQPKRHQTLHSAIGWSYDLLKEDVRRTFRVMSVFAGGSDFDALTSVIGGDDLAVLEHVETLVDSSLVRRVEDGGAGRFTMLETIREFAQDELRRAGEEESARNAHRDFYRALADRLTPELTGENQSSAMARLDQERDNLRAALDWTERSGESEAQGQLTLSLWRYWLVRGLWNEGREWLRRALRGDNLVGSTRAQLLVAAGSLAQNQGDYATALDSLGQALTIWREIGDQAGEARTLASMGWLGWRQCRYEDARRLSEESLELHRALGDESGVAQSLSNLGWVALFEGRYAEAETLLNECLTIRRSLGERRNIAFALTALGWASARLEKTEAAQRMLDEAVAIFREIGEKQLYAFAQRVRAEMLLSAGDNVAALALVHTESVPIFRELGDRWGLAFALGMEGDALLAADSIEEAERVYNESLLIWCALDDQYGIALTRSRLGVTSARRGNLDVAAEHLAIADRMLDEIHGAMPPYQRAMHQSASRGLSSGY